MWERETWIQKRVVHSIIAGSSLDYRNAEKAPRPSSKAKANPQQKRSPGPDPQAPTVRARKDLNAQSTGATQAPSVHPKKLAASSQSVEKRSTANYSSTGDAHADICTDH
jgi:hypothetical protein